MAEHTTKWLIVVGVLLIVITIAMGFFRCSEETWMQYRFPIASGLGAGIGLGAGLLIIAYLLIADRA